MEIYRDWTSAHSIQAEVEIRLIECLVTHVLTLLMLSGHFYNLSGHACHSHPILYLYIHLHNNGQCIITLNQMRMRRSQSCGYVDFWFWVVWPIAWFDYFTLEIVRREASKVWTRYNGGKPGSYSTMHASVHENEMWNDIILNARSSSRCHLRKVTYLRCSFLVGIVHLASSLLEAIHASWVGLARLQTVGHAYRPLIMVGHCNKTHGIWPMTACNFNLCPSMLGTNEDHLEHLF